MQAWWGYILCVSLNYQGEKPLDGVKGMWPEFSFLRNHIFFILSQNDSSISIILGLERPRFWWLKTPLLCGTEGVPWGLCNKGLVPSLGCYRNLTEIFSMWGLMRGFRSWEVVPLKGIVGHRPLPHSLWLASAMRQTGFLHHTFPQWSALLP